MYWSDPPNSGTLIPVTAVQLNEMINSYAAAIQDRREVEEEKYWVEIRKEMAEPKWFGLIKGNLNPTPEELEAYVAEKMKDRHVWWAKPGFELDFEARKSFLKQMRTTLDVAAKGMEQVYLAREDANRLKGGW